MKPVLVTQRVVCEAGERRDALEQSWHALLARAGLRALLVPNCLAAAEELWEGAPAAGLLLTGGNDLAALGGDAPERDRVEAAALERALARGLPVLGVCRGMQLLLERHGAAHERVEGHVAARQEILVAGAPALVNSFHRWGARDVGPELEVWARARDGVVKAVRHRARPLVGIMWHPERLEPFRADDVALLRALFGGAPAEERACAG